MIKRLQRREQTHEYKRIKKQRDFLQEDAGRKDQIIKDLNKELDDLRANKNPSNNP